MKLNALKPVKATTLVIDLRAFTSSLNSASVDEHGVNMFSAFLSRFYALCLESALLSLPPSLRDIPPLHIDSTGDGMIIVFFDTDDHHIYAFLTAILIHSRLSFHISNSPINGFGIGLESGFVSKVFATSDALSVNTFIGECINTAARAESLTKTLFRAKTIIGPRLNNLLTQDLLGTDYDSIRSIADAAASDVTTLEQQRKMMLLNQALCLSFVYVHRLKGLHEPIPLYRLSESIINGNCNRFNQLLRKLTVDDEHLELVTTHLNACFPTIQGLA